MYDKVLPQDISAERIVLASIMKNNDTITEIMDIVSDKDFYRTSHSLLYNNMVTMFTKDIPIEVESLFNFLGQDKINAIGGITYLSQLIATELTTNALFYAKVVKEKSDKRKIIKSCTEAVEKAYQNGETSEIIEGIENSFISFQNMEKEKTVNLEELMYTVMSDIDRKFQNGSDIPGIKTGFNTLDKATNGYQKGDLWIMAARPSMGKTLFNLNLLANLPKGNNALMFELEMTKEKIGNRLLSARSKVHSKILARGKLTEEEFKSVSFYCNEMAQKDNVYLNCKTGIGLGYIRSEAKKIKIKYGLDVIFVDHIGLLKGSNPHNKNLEIGELTSGLKSIAKDLDVCIVILSQLSRACELRQDKHPMLSDLRDSGNLEQDADTVMMLYRDDYYAEREQRESSNPNILEAFIAKNRDGEVGALEFYCDLEKQFIGEADFTGR